MSSKVKLQLKFEGAVLTRKAVFFRPCHPNQIADAVRIICGLSASERPPCSRRWRPRGHLNSLEPGLYEVPRCSRNGGDGDRRQEQARSFASSAAASASFLSTASTTSAAAPSLRCVAPETPARFLLRVSAWQWQPRLPPSSNPASARCGHEWCWVAQRHASASNPTSRRRQSYAGSSASGGDSAQT